MIAPAVIFLLSLLGLAVSWTMPDLFLLAALSMVASLILLLLALRKWRRTRHKWAVIDGSNVMYWQGGSPNIDTVRAVVTLLTAIIHEASVFGAGRLFPARSVS